MEENNISNENHVHSHNDEMSDFDSETRASIQEMQILEQNFEQLMQQKHIFNMEISETKLALDEIEKSDGDLFKIVGGQVMIKMTKEKLKEDLEKKNKLLEARMKNIEEQEKSFSGRIETIRQEIISKISPDKNNN